MCWIFFLSSLNAFRFFFMFTILFYFSSFQQISLFPSSLFGTFSDLKTNLRSLKKLIKMTPTVFTCIDLDSDLLYPGPRNLMQTDPDSGQSNHKIDFKTSFKSQNRLLIWKSEPKSQRLATFLGSGLKNIISCEKKMLVKLCFSFISYLWVWSTDPNHCLPES